VAEAEAQWARAREELADERRRVAALEASLVEPGADGGTDEAGPTGAFRELFRKMVRHEPPSRTARPK
jgi:hypothetical protein